VTHYTSDRSFEDELTTIAYGVLIALTQLWLFRPFNASPSVPQNLSDGLLVGLTFTPTMREEK
jgi:hypothetical protein